MSAASEPLATFDELVEMSKHPKFVGIGETGLDYHYTAESADIQKESLRIHIAAARQTGLPLIIHARGADDDMARILAEEHANGAYTCVMHCFSSSLNWRAQRWTLASICRCRESAHSPKAKRFATSLPPPLLSACWWKLMHPTLRHRHIGASAMNPPTPRTQQRLGQKCSVWSTQILRPKPNPTLSACSLRPPTTRQTLNG